MPGLWADGNAAPRFRTVGLILATSHPETTMCLLNETEDGKAIRPSAGSLTGIKNLPKGCWRLSWLQSGHRPQSRLQSGQQPSASARHPRRIHFEQSEMVTCRKNLPGRCWELSWLQSWHRPQSRLRKSQPSSATILITSHSAYGCCCSIARQRTCPHRQSQRLPGKGLMPCRATSYGWSDMRDCRRTKGQG